ncbi:uncharacterized protein LOC144595597 [Rhinoraja longicauda]
MELVFSLLLCHFLSTNGKQMHKIISTELQNGREVRCNLAKKEAISQSQWQVENNNTIHFLGVILQNSSLENMVCSKSIKTTLKRDRDHHLIAEKPNTCVFTNSCTATENVTLTVLILPSSGQHQSVLEDRLVTACRNAKGGLADNIVGISSINSISRKYKTKQKNANKNVINSYKSTQQRNNLENVTCLIRHPTASSPLELFIRCPFKIQIKSNRQRVKGRKNKFIFNTTDSERTIQVKITGSVKQVNLNCSKQNGSLPEGIKLIKNNLKFKAPMKESYAGIYVCVASNQHWKLSAQLEIEITSDEKQWIVLRATLITSCVIFAASVCFFIILRWHRKKQLIVIPQQYSIQNFGYQTSTEDCRSIKTPQDRARGAGSVCTPADSPKDIASTDGINK